jgi:hypothetical protein
MLDLQEVDLTLKPGDLRLKLVSPVRERAIPGPEALRVEFACEVELIDLLGFLREAFILAAHGVEEFLLRVEVPVGAGEACRDRCGREREAPQFPLEDPLQVRLGHLVPAALADVLRGVRGHVHFAAALAEGEPGEEVDRPPGSLALAEAPRVDDCIRRIPEVGRHDGFDRHQDPLMRGLEDHPLAMRVRLGVVRAVLALRVRVFEEERNRRLGEGSAGAGPVAALVQDARDGLVTAVLDEEIVDEAADGRLCWIGDEPLVLAHVPEGRRAAGRFAELGADGHRGRHPRGDLLPLPGGHAGDHGVEEAAGGGGGVDRLFKGDEVGALCFEELRKLQKLLGVPREPRELGEDEARDASGAHVFHHPARLGVRHDGLPGDAGEVIEGHDLPALDIGVGSRPVLVVLGAFALGLVFGRDPDPDRDPLQFRLIGLLYLAHVRASFRARRLYPILG